MKSPLFLVGAGRCGTTLLFQALAAHPRIGLTNEAHVADYLCFVTRLAALPDDESADFDHEGPVRLRGIVTREFAPQFARLFSDHAVGMFFAFYERLFPDKDLRWFGDKMPAPRVAVEVRRAIPTTRILTLVRDPWDYVCSARAYARRPDLARAYPHLDVPIRAHAEHWGNVYRAAIASDGAAALIRYEQLVRDPDQVVRQALATLELPEHPACFDGLRDGTLFAHHGTSSTPESSIGRWRRDLSPSDVAVVREVCGDVAAAAGYAAPAEAAGAAP